MLKDPKVQEDPLLAEDLDAAIYDLKEAILSDDLELAGVCESDLMYLLDELS